MKLKSFGCSFIFGTDLHDDSRFDVKATSSNYTWPAMLAKKHGWDYTCYARPGAGNMEIAERLLTQSLDTEPSVYVVGWSWIDRFSYSNGRIPVSVGQEQNDEYLRVKNASWATPWQSLMPVDSSAVANMYYRHLHSELADKFVSLINIKTAIDALKVTGNKFIMTYMDHLLFDQSCNTTPAIAALQGYCRPYMTLFDNKNFLEWSRDQGFDISATQHPLEAAHQAGAELIDSYSLV